MPVTVSYPGVYVQEVPSGVRTITGVSTSTALFVGQCADGPMDTPIRLFNYTDFTRNFSEDGATSDLARYVKLFFLNGGTTCWVVRIASGALKAKVTLNAEGGAALSPSLDLVARNPGLIGNSLRIAVDYDTERPESTFNLRVFRRGRDAGGNPVELVPETWRNLSMDPTSATYAPTYLTQNSKLVEATLAAGAPAATSGFSQSRRPVPLTAGSAAAWDAIVTGGAQAFDISVGGSAFATVDLTTTLGTAGEATLLPAIVAAIKAALAPLPGNPGLTVAVDTELAPPALFGAGAGTGKWIRIVASADVVVRPAVVGDAAVALMLGTAQGGFEKGAFADRRPAPSGVSIRPSAIVPATASRFSALDPGTILTLSGPTGPALVTFAELGGGLQTGVANAATWRDSYPVSLNDNSDGIRQKLALIASRLNEQNSPWSAKVTGYRLTFTKRDTADDAVLGPITVAGWNLTVAERGDNSALYALGTPAAGATRFATAGAAGDDGTPPKGADYDRAYLSADAQIDLFNLLVLPSAVGVDRSLLWGTASVFCQRKRAFLVMDAPEWADAQAATDTTTGVAKVRIGLVKDYAALYFPRLVINENGLERPIGASGAVAGVMARTDGTRGVWKAPAGLEASLRGVVGLESRFSDLENGALNPRAINTLRVFPSGIVVWGARTVDGDDNTGSDWKYVPIRRLALFLEESLYRGIQWAVFEPNDEPLWAQLRMNVGSFMHSLFLQGAFQGSTSTDAYFVRCDEETTTQDDRNKGIVNIVVGFAPLKPAEFVVLYLQQMAGQVQV